MPTIVKKSRSVLVETHHDISNTLVWHSRPSVWRPPTDIYETDEHLVVRIEIAGMRDEDIEVTFQGNLLLINGFRSDVSGRKAFHQMEILFGKFSLGIEIPVQINIDNANAEYKDGFLTILMPKDK